MTQNTKLNLLVEEVLDDISKQLQGNGKQLWFLYDDLDKDLPEEGNLRNEALTGLFQLVQSFDNPPLAPSRNARRVSYIREGRVSTSFCFKIFLREDIWHQLTFDTKSYFNGRNIILQWTREDFLRLALRQTQQSEEFKDLVDHFTPVENIDQADEVSIDRALQLLWGTRRESNANPQYISRWVYDRLTDASRTAFPGSVNVLLTEAKKHALSSNPDPSLPTDRLLPTMSLNEGLLQASRQRCAEVREEYPELKPFFAALADFEALIPKQQLQGLWEKNVKDIFPDFSKFVEFLLDIGLFRLVESRGKEQSYQFAEIYASGFNMRGRRK